VNDTWDNTEAAANTAGGEAAPGQFPPDDAAPPGVVSGSEPTGPASHAPEATSGEEIEAAEAMHMPEPEVEVDPEHEPQGIAVAIEDDDRPVKMDWYILKVQSNREDSIREGLKRNVERAGLGKYFGDVIVPIETVTELEAVSGLPGRADGD
jgi:transcriptional antiterminator NusG